MHAVYQEVLPPSGVEFATCLNLTPASLPPKASSHPNTAARQEFVARALCNVVVARSNLLRIYEVREELAPMSSQAELDEKEREREKEREKRGKVRKGTEAVEGEVMMDTSGEGFVNIAKLQGQKHSSPLPTVTRFLFVREHLLHGAVTGLERVKTIASLGDRLDRLLVSFKDAKIALLEWSDSVHDLVTVSIHTYERAPQLMSLDSPLFHSTLRTDPLSRCAVLSLPRDALAILPFYQTLAELDVMEQDQTREIPYAPSFILDLPAQVDESIRNVVDFVFLPGFNNPTMAILFQTELTWTGRLKEFKDTFRVLIFTLNLVTQTYPVITSIEGLPHDSFALLPCSPELGGAIVLSSNSIIYIDQSASRRVALPLNGWAPRISDIPFQTLTTEEELQRDLKLEGSQGVFVDDKTFFLILKDGSVYPIELVVDGKMVVKLNMSKALAQTTLPSVVKSLVIAPVDAGDGLNGSSLGEDVLEGPGRSNSAGMQNGLSRMVGAAGGQYLLVGSSVGPTVLLRTSHVEEEVPDGQDIEMETSPAAVVRPTDDMDMYDDDDDIYGASANNPADEDEGQANGSSGAGKAVVKKTRTMIHLSLCDFLPAYGPIADMAFSLARNGERSVPELVAATGSGPLGGFTLFQRDLPIRTKRKLHAIGGARGMWSLSIRQPIKSSGNQYERQQHGNDTLIISTDANPSPGLSRISMRTGKTDISITTRIPGTTIGAAPFFQRTAILHVMTNAIRVLEPDGTERQIIKDMDGNMPRPRIKHCSICDPFVLIVREDDSIGLFIGEPERGKIRRKDMSPMGEKTSRYLTGAFYTDTSGLFEAQLETPNTASQNITSTLQAALNGAHRTQWLLLVRPQGVLEIWTLPKLTLVWSNSLISNLSNVLTDSLEAPALSLPQDPPRRSQDLDIEQILMAPIGSSSPATHLCVFLRSGILATYEVLPAGSIPVEPTTGTRTSTLKIKMVKAASRAFEIQRSEETTEKSILAEQKRVQRLFVPFTTSPQPLPASTSASGSSSAGSKKSYSGVFFTGDRPSWIIGTDRGGLQIIPSGHAVVHAFTSCSLWDSKGDFLVYSEEGPSLLEWIPDWEIEGPLPFRSVPRGRPYSNVVFDPNTMLIIAGSSLEAEFASFDEDGNQIWEPDAPNISDPTCECSTVELISPDLWVTLDGYEFATNEFINSMSMITLETSSTENGVKDFLAIGTTINRGEDLAVKGATYIFEIVEVVPDAKLAPKRWYKLRLRCKDDAKGPVTAVCGFHGYIVSSMGQKIFVRAFDADERLVGVAFMDVGVYVTSLKALKNLLLIGDAVKSVWFVAFQEDPYKLVLLAKDTNRVCITNSDFFFTDGELSIITGDEDGILRVYEFNPTDPDSRDGRTLLIRTEFHRQCEYRTSTIIARRTKEELDIPQSKLIAGSADGSIFSLTPVPEQSYKRLQLLQGQLTRNIQHVAGLNPRAFRIVRNDYLSKPLSKGILDGNLLCHYEALPISRQSEVTQEIGTERITVLHDWISVCGPW